MWEYMKVNNRSNCFTETHRHIYPIITWDIFFFCLQTTHPRLMVILYDYDMTMKMILMTTQVKPKHIPIMIKGDAVDNDHGCCMTITMTMMMIMMMKFTATTMSIITKKQKQYYEYTKNNSTYHHITQ